LSTPRGPPFTALSRQGGSDYAHAVHELNKSIDRAEGLLMQ